MRSNVQGIFAAGVMALFVLVALFADVIVPKDPLGMDLLSRTTPPTWSWTGLGEHPLGTDLLGRDIFSRIIAGAQTVLLVGVVSVVLGGFLGVTLGLVAGYAGGWIDRMIMRLADVQLSIPIMLFALIVVAALGPSLVNLVAVLALTGWTRFARVIRGQVLAIREFDFVLSAKSAGASALRILVFHILPNVMNSIVVIASLDLARVILLEASLSFLGLGVQPPTSSWGRMLAEGRTYIASAWWISTLPGFAILIVVFSVSMLGDWLRDLVDPTSRFRGPGSK
ncbi:ABC transporter permease [Salipiger mucosus]|uniref:Dipeptide transport system permease protein DppC n=1 Tax=Salipiger mucosus DSM 16094 TaxID=1123237 RepID=S9Q8B3_9RHOB|nr:ABC transporter permease [Salipiger mucosus]EPX75863.1 Dipeptide transport system permease protein DppC [Salipiger mucosus DSM 16094]